MLRNCLRLRQKSLPNLTGIEGPHWAPFPRDKPYPRHNVTSRKKFLRREEPYGMSWVLKAHTRGVTRCRNGAVGVRTNERAQARGTRERDGSRGNPQEEHDQTRQAR